ncbi:MAG: Flp family type IVb pilin [Armatimonadota bacterium]
MVEAGALKKLWMDEIGVTSVEYAFMLAVLVLASVVAFGNLSAEVETTVYEASSTMQEESPGVGCSSG